ncbi:hypothetical protein NFHSH190041_20960 [Shewanella sp. NFH-SH190041]|uniref:lipocalin family protein n=1 Tax=Shewanella sp. NFH-SH190041 TaxID=2950245 RepID=UPI0021C396C5|nr:lipocalin family protein [Shewanella sp. NFH-SH190041]BDM64644.1 hypothetical protein NFHSH190041_20960 [Shewanella sp. NFH-SH190041]
MRILLLVTFSLLLNGCTVMDRKVDVVTPFTLSPYLGKWYEIARLDHSFEQGLTKVTAEYSLSPEDPGLIRVINRGYRQEDDRWQQAHGRAHFWDSDQVGRFKVAFFRPFYGAYQIHDIISYQGRYIAALVIGPDIDYVWILSRTPELSDAVAKRFLAKLEQLGVDTSALIWLSPPPQ